MPAKEVRIRTFHSWKTYYELPFNHFHGTITNRKELLIDRDKIDTRIHEIKEDLKDQNEKFQELQKLQTKRKRLSEKLNSFDKELIKNLSYLTTNKSNRKP